VDPFTPTPHLNSAHQGTTSAQTSYVNSDSATDATVNAAYVVDCRDNFNFSDAVDFEIPANVLWPHSIPQPKTQLMCFDLLQSR
jgi:hypothetical protein